MNKEFQQLTEIIKNNSTFVLTTHVNPDGDGIGSVLTMYRILKAYNKEVSIINISETPHYLRFLDRDSVIEQFDAQIHPEKLASCDVFMALDFNTVDRMGKMAPVFSSIKGKKVCIDHHQNPQQVFDVYVCSIEYCATGHILYDYISKSNIVPFTNEYAEPLYAAVMTDTGSFRFERTTPEVHLMAAQCLEQGVNPTEVYRAIYDQNPFGKMTLLGQALSGIELYGDAGEIAVMTVTQNQLAESGMREDDTDGFINICMSVGCVKMGLKFLELKQGFKISLRSKGEIPVHAFASQYGGGGHKNAAGIRFREGNMFERKAEIIASALEFFKGVHHE
jgi:phosphoesterase RecJ-like protein